ncbi:hypothetical protein [Hydrogenophaga sp.]|uniref:hypothetical protein n=1 Tax=Hydrogenophaga sp. TaxID=1904254 RepID=UPI003AF7133F
MQALMETPPGRSGTPLWFWSMAAFGLLWNLYGVYQFAGSLGATTQSLVAAGMTPAQAEVYLALPAWISTVFAVGVLGGLVGSLALLARRRWAAPLFTASLVGYALLLAGDAYHGVFDSMPSQLAILAFVVLVAVGLLMTTRLASRRGLLD